MPLDGDDYKVGYGKPPVDTRFKKGRSGNPSGRPRGKRTVNLDDALNAASHERIGINEKGRRKTITRIEAMAKQIAYKASLGAPMFVRLAAKLLPPEWKPPGENGAAETSNADGYRPIDFSIFAPEELKKAEAAAMLLEDLYRKAHPEEEDEE